MRSIAKKKRLISVAGKGSRWGVMVAMALGLTAWAHADAGDPSGAPAQAPSSQNAKAADFIQQAARNNAEEVALAEVAARKAQNQELKRYAEHVQQERLQTDTELAPLAHKYGVTLEQSLPKQAEKKLARFQKLSGTQFDQQYAQEALREQERDLATFERAAREIRTSDVRQYASQQLTRARERLGQATEVAEAVGVDQTTISSILNRPPEAVGGTGEDQQTSQGAGAKSLESAGKNQ